MRYSRNKVSLIIIAHNEENNIESCIESVLSQSLKADEIIIILHNCTDRTSEKIEKYHDKIRIINHNTAENGPQYARKKGFQEAQYEIIACIDGDSRAVYCWLEEITAPLERNKHIVGV